MSVSDGSSNTYLLKTVGPQIHYQDTSEFTQSMGLHVKVLYIVSLFVKKDQIL